MDPQLAKLVADQMPKFNERVCRGYATYQMKATLPYMDKIIRSASPLFPEGLIFRGHSIGSPSEHFNLLAQGKGKDRSIDISRHDFYLTKFLFEYQGKEIDLPIFVMFFRDGGLFTHRGTTYAVSPALTDIGFSVTHSGIFIRFKRTCCNFSRETHHVVVDGQLRHCNLYWSAIHHEVNRNARKRDLLNNRPYIHSTLCHYFFCKWGFQGAMERFANTQVHVCYKHEVDRKAYPANRYAYVNSSVVAGKGIPGAEIVVIVPRDKIEDEFVLTMLGSFFYVFDAFVNSFVDLVDINNPRHWLVLLGRIVKGDWEKVGSLVTGMENHMASTDTQLDEITQASLAERGIQVNDIYGLFYEIMTTLAPCFLNTANDEASMYNKRLSVAPFVLHQS